MTSTHNFEMPADRVRLNEPLDLRYWCEKLDCTPAELSKAVSLVGNSAAAVERILENERQLEIGCEVTR